MDRLILTTSMVLVAVGCQRQAPRDLEIESQLITDDTLGVSLELPPLWLTSYEGTALVISGPADSSAYYTTISVQRAPSSANGLGEQLMEAYSPAAELSGFQWTHREPRVVGAFAAIGYSLRFDLHETPRRKMGVLVAGPRGPLDISCGAPDDLFIESIPVFEHALGSVSLF